MAKELYPFEGYKISEDSAAELFAHHLMLACRLYANVSEDLEQVSQEAERLMKEAEFDKREIDAAREFGLRLWEMYEEMKKND